MQTDVTNQASVENLAKATHDAFGRIDILVNNAAFPGGLVRGSLEEAEEEPLLEDIDTKVMGYFRCSKAVAPYMKQRNWGRIVNIGGLSGRRSHVISGLRNAAVAHMAKSLSDDLGPLWHHCEPDSSQEQRGRERSGPMYEEQARRARGHSRRSYLPGRIGHSDSENRRRQRGGVRGCLSLLAQGPNASPARYSLWAGERTGRSSCSRALVGASGGYFIDYLHFLLGDVAGGQVAKGFALVRGEIFLLLGRNLIGAVEPSQPYELGAVCVHPVATTGTADFVVDGPDMPVEQV